MSRIRKSKYNAVVYAHPLMVSRNADDLIVNGWMRRKYNKPDPPPIQSRIHHSEETRLIIQYVKLVN